MVSSHRGTVVNMGVEDHHEARVILASPEKLARISEVSGVFNGDEGSGVVEVDDAVGGLGSRDTAQEFDVSVAVGSREVTGEAPVERSWEILGSELALEESAGDIISTELDEGQVSVLDDISDDRVNGEEEEMVISSGGVGDGIVDGAGGVLFHSAETGCHALEGVIREELELEEQEESVVDSLLDELECFVSNEHLLHLLGESWHDRVAKAIHREEEVGLGSPGLQRSGGRVVTCRGSNGVGGEVRASGAEISGAGREAGSATEKLRTGTVSAAESQE